MKIDHVTIAGTDLQTLQDGFAQAGISANYGGPHSNGVTHMALLGFDDGSYIELISKKQPDMKSPWWDRHITNDGGPCAWSVEAEDVYAETKRLAELQIPVTGPVYYQRERPDGKLVEWDLAVVGNGDLGAVHPFIIQDRTPRNYRVSPSSSVSATELTGISLVIIAVNDIETTSNMFQKVYHAATPVFTNSSYLLANLAIFPNESFALASPSLPESLLTDRLNFFGESPCGFLIGSKDMTTSTGRFNVNHQEIWGNRQIMWLEADEVNTSGLGIISH